MARRTTLLVFANLFVLVVAFQLELVPRGSLQALYPSSGQSLAKESTSHNFTNIEHHKRNQTTRQDRTKRGEKEITDEKTQPNQEILGTKTEQEERGRLSKEKARDARRKQNSQIANPDVLKNLSTPVFVLSLPKSGTTSLASFFRCGGLRSPHTYLRKNGTSGESIRIGECLHGNYITGRPLLDGCGSDYYHVYSDIGITKPHICFYPTLQALDKIAADYPNATLIFSYRQDWVEGAGRWNNWIQRSSRYCPFFPNVTVGDSAEKEWNAMYTRLRQDIRALAKTHPTLRLLDFNLTDPTAGEQLEAFSGISANCWKDIKPNQKAIDKQKMTSRLHQDDAVEKS